MDPVAQKTEVRQGAQPPEPSKVTRGFLKAGSSEFLWHTRMAAAPCCATASCGGASGWNQDLPSSSCYWTSLAQIGSSGMLTSRGTISKAGWSLRGKPVVISSVNLPSLIHHHSIYGRTTCSYAALQLRG